MFKDWGVSDYLSAVQIIIAALNIIIMAFIAIWVVQSVQRKMDSEKTHRDFFSRELIALRTDLRAFLDKLIRGDMEAKAIKREHHLLSVRIQDILTALNTKFGIDKKYLKAYRQNLMKIIEADSNYVDLFGTDGRVSFNHETVSKIHTLRTSNDHLFNDILLKIYETK